MNYSDDDLKRLGLVEISPGVYKKVRLSDYAKIYTDPERVKAKKELVDLFKPSKDVTGAINPDMVYVNMKPLSINEAFQGRRFKTEAYKSYEKAVLSMLPKYTLPAPPYKLEILLGVSSKLADLDNPVKLITDILQKAYEFNDKLIYELSVKKTDVAKRKEYFQFRITNLA